ncbi:nuclear transport factor 2 family protein [Thermomonospora umbrina]|uniref:SnoaL-like protein n=1 Tax=Thermomonospora umbrina TaxID=111806 RepID=A0A3D9SXL8_9ACTN|nr:nuclear transport factor 2 family protein [Thermomonospora umbrina]REF00703.1 SnoaL-like protein [Thermomonospora umbrina]
MPDLSFTQARADDRALITAVLHRYAHTARDKMDFDDMLPLFADDARVLLPDGTPVPATSLSDVLRGEEAAYIRHHLTTIDIVFDGDGTARTEAAFLAVTDEAAPDHWGCWRDVFTRQADGRWLISERAIVVDGGAPEGWFHRRYLGAAGDSGRR